MDRMQKTFIILLTLSQANAFDRSPDISVGVGVEHQSNQLLGHFSTLALKDTGVPKLLLENLTLEGNNSVLTFELSQRVNKQISTGVRTHFKSAPFSFIGSSVAMVNESPQVEVLTKYHLNQATYGVGIGIKKDSYSLSPDPFNPFTHYFGESITPSVSLSSTVQLPGAKLELHASLARAVFVDSATETDTSDNENAFWQTTSRVSLHFNI
jgi:hypothetical protein